MKSVPLTMRPAAKSIPLPDGYREGKGLQMCVCQDKLLLVQPGMPPLIFDPKTETFEELRIA